MLASPNIPALCLRGCTSSVAQTNAKRRLLLRTRRILASGFVKIGPAVKREFEIVQGSKARAPAGGASEVAVRNRAGDALQR